jgi:hypothetical protein
VVVSNGSGSSGCADADPLAAQRHGDREQGLSSQNISETTTGSLFFRTTTVRDPTMNYLVHYVTILHLRRDDAAQHTHYGSVHTDAGHPRAMRASSGPPGACTDEARIAIFGRALSREFSAQKKINNTY